MRVSLVMLYFGYAGVLLALGDYFSKRWASGTLGVSGLLLAATAYMLSLPGWFLGMKHHPQLVKMALLWNLVLTMASVLVGLLVFRERLAPTHVVGGVLALASIVLLSR
jgi:drug/metabolite transporter (DMT)-like permease